jgi:cell volume regulation protein A
MLGLLVSPGRITWEHVGLAFAAGLVLTFLARPLSVVVYTLVQAGPLGVLAQWAGVRNDGTRDIEVEAAPLERISADLLQAHVSRGSKLAGVQVDELRLPEGASVALVVRGGEPVEPHRITRFRRGDDILVVTTRSVREATEKRLREVGRHGRLAGWT